MVVEMHGALRREQARELLPRQAMRVRGRRLEDHQIRDVDDAHAQGRTPLPQERGRRHHFEGELAADPHEDHVGREPGVGAAELPDGAAGSAVRRGFGGGEEDGLRLLGADHEVGVVGGVQAVGDGGEEGVGVGGEVDAGGLRLEVEHGADEGRVLVGEAVVLLSRPGAGFDVVEGGEGAAEAGFARHLVEFAVLDHHGVDDAEEGLVRGEDSRASGEGVAWREGVSACMGEGGGERALEEPLTCVFTKYFNDSSSLRVREFIPLEIASGMLEDGVKLITDKFIWRK